MENEIEILCEELRRCKQIFEGLKDDPAAKLHPAHIEVIRDRIGGIEKVLECYEGF